MKIHPLRVAQLVCATLTTICIGVASLGFAEIASAQADLAVTKAATATVPAGNNITYSIVVTNGGPSAAANVSLTDALPTNTTFVLFTAPCGWVSTTPAVGGTGTVTATNTSLANGANASFTLVVNVNGSTSAGSLRVEGVLERVDGVTRFTRYTTFASLKVSSESDAAKARRLLEKAGHVCLISNSLRGQRALVTEVVNTG